MQENHVEDKHIEESRLEASVVEAYAACMELRPADIRELNGIAEIDAAIDSADYLHVDRSGEGLAVAWRLEQRPVRDRRVQRNTLSDELRFALKQILSGFEEGASMVAEHDGQIIAAALARIRSERGVFELLDLRVDSDFRRQGIGSALIYQLIAQARQQDLRAVYTRTLTDNLPACRFMAKAGLEIAGLDSSYATNHDLVKESATLFWYLHLK